MYCTYLTVYSGNKLPPFYIGYSSVKKVKNGYHGSVVSKAYKEIWKSEIKENPHLFKTIILTTHETRIEASNRETVFQTHLRVHRNPLYINRHIGATRFFNTGYTFSEAHRKKISESQKGIKKPSLLLKESTRKNALKAHEATRGVPKSKEHREKISKSNKGRVNSPESITKMAETKRGTKLSEETKAKMSLSRTGKIQSIETRLKNSKRVTDGIRVFSSKIEAAEFHQIDKKTVYNRIKQKRDGWKYV